MTDRSITFSNSTLPVPRVVSLNLNNLSYYNTTPSGRARHRRIVACLQNLSKRADIICLQETGLARNEAHALSSSLPNCKISLSSCRMGVGGVAVVDCPSLCSRFSVNNLPLSPSVEGHALVRTYHPKDPLAGYSAFQVINVYFFTGERKEARQTELIHELIKIDNKLPTFLCGDFNFTLRNEDSTSNEHPSLEFRNLWDHFLNYFSLMEVDSDEHTFYRFTSAATHSARLDRFYIPSSLLLSPIVMPVVSTTLHTVLYSKPPTRTSFTDHLPLSLSFSSTSSPTHQPHSPRIPQWVAESPEFAETVSSLIVSTPLSNSPFRALLDLKRIFHLAARRVKRSVFSCASSLQLLTAQIRLLKLIAIPLQSRSSITDLLDKVPALGSLVSLRDGRYSDNGLSDAITVSLSLLSAPRTFLLICLTRSSS